MNVLMPEGEASSLIMRAFGSEDLFGGVVLSFNNWSASRLIQGKVRCTCKCECARSKKYYFEKEKIIVIKQKNTIWLTMDV